MTGENNVAQSTTTSSSADGNARIGKIITLGIALVYVLVSGYLLLDMRGRISGVDHDQQKAAQRITSLESDLAATSDALASRVGMTQQELANKTAALQASQHAAVSRLSKEQKQAIGEVKSDVDVAKTRLDATDAKLEGTIGDLGVQSGLIAHNRDELELLKHKGDRTYFDFTLLKGKPPTRVSTISLQLKNVDPKKNRFTLNVLADDMRVEKKDRNTEEPLQFYSGKAHQLFEVVVLTAAKNRVSGYLSTPKAPQDVSRLEGAENPQ